MNRVWIALSLLASPAFADIEGFRVPATMQRDEPIDGWTVFRKDDTVHYFLCRASAESCDRKTDAKEIAEKRSVPYETWLGEVARNYQLEAKVLLNAPATAKRIQATIAALNNIVSEESKATDEERKTAKEKLESLTKKDGYESRFKQARTLAQAVEPGDKPVVFEASDKRAFRVLWPFNFDLSVVERTDDAVTTADIVTELQWIASKTAPQRFYGVTAVCEKFGARGPTADEVKKAAPWLVVSPLATTLDREASKAVGAAGRAFWLPSTGRSLRVNVEGNRGELRPLAESAKTKVYHYYEGRYDYFDLDAERAGGGTTVTFTPTQKVIPKIVQKQSGTTYITFYDVVEDPKDEEVLTQTSQYTPPLSVLCVRRRSLDAR